MTARGLTVINRLGQRIGKLLVTERGPNLVEKNSVRARWWCQCDCGKTVLVVAHSLQKGAKGVGGTRSCGCLLGRTIKHGMRKSTEYRIWHMMKQRCANPKNSGFKNYGARGITICERWEKFENFLADMGRRPANTTLDREDNLRGYSPENCRWATKVQQANNRRTNVFLSAFGKKMTLAQWGVELGIGTQCIRSRLNSGWTVEKALSTPIQRINFQE